MFWVFLFFEIVIQLCKSTSLDQKKVIMDNKKKEKRIHLYWVYLGEVDMYSADLWWHSHLGKASLFLRSSAQCSLSVTSTPTAKKALSAVWKSQPATCWDSGALQKQPALARLCCAAEPHRRQLDGMRFLLTGLAAEARGQVPAWLGPWGRLLLAPRAE